MKQLREDAIDKNDKSKKKEAEDGPQSSYG